jgi:hypothetical protein
MVWRNNILKTWVFIWKGNFKFRMVDAAESTKPLKKQPPRERIPHCPCPPNEKKNFFMALTGQSFAHAVAAGNRALLELQLSRLNEKRRIQTSTRVVKIPNMMW